MKSVAVKSPVTFQLETIAATWESAFPLMLAHHREVGPLPQERFRPDRAFYDNLERAGVLMVFTMRAESKLVGYGTFVVLPLHPFYPQSTWARQDCLYVAPAHRGPMASEFLRWQDDAIRERYPDVEIIRHVTPKKDYSPLLEALGYRPMEWAWIRDRQEAKLA